MRPFLHIVFATTSPLNCHWGQSPVPLHVDKGVAKGEVAFLLVEWREGPWWKLLGLGEGSIEPERKGNPPRILVDPTLVLTSLYWETYHTNSTGRSNVDDSTMLDVSGFFFYCSEISVVFFTRHSNRQQYTRLLRVPFFGVHAQEKFPVFCLCFR